MATPPTRGTVARFEPPDVKLTVPVGVAPTGEAEMVAVRVTAEPTRAGLGLAVRTSTATSGFTCCESVALLARKEPVGT